MKRYYVITFEERKEFSTVSSVVDGGFDISEFWNGKTFCGSIPNGFKLFVEKGVMPDYLPNAISWFIVSDRFLQILSELAPDSFQAIPAPLFDETTKQPIPGYQVINVIKTIDALRNPKASVPRLELIASSVPSDLHFFRAEGKVNLKFASEEIRQAVRNAKLKGIDWIPIPCN